VSFLIDGKYEELVSQLIEALLIGGASGQELIVVLFNEFNLLSII
jgi:hypothetical protein